MLFSLALIMILGFSLSALLNRLRIPGLLGMILTGMLLGPHVLNLISPQILGISPELREIALIVILTRAGLSIDIRDLKRVGRPAVLMCFLPATFEIAAVTLLAPLLLGIGTLEAAILGTVLAAVSPAVTVPRMLHLMESGHGRRKSIPQLIMAGASVDDIYVIVLFTAFMGMHRGADFSAATLLSVPVSIVTGVALGAAAGYLMVKVFKRFHIRDTVKVLILLSVAFLFMSIEDALKPVLPVSGLLAVMAMGIVILETYGVLAKRLMGKFSKVWVGAEVFLFVLVGAAVDIRTLPAAGLGAVALILGALAFRTLGVGFALMKTPLTARERLFCALAYLPKATVQAAVGAIPLAQGVAAGNIILTVAVLSILIAAPVGALGIDHSYRRLLTQE